MIAKIPFFYRNKPLGDRQIDIPDEVKCPICGYSAELGKTEISTIGPRYYAQYWCWSIPGHHFKIRINELTELEIAKLKGGENHG